MTCETCGCPDWAVKHGRKLEITRRAENGFQRDRKTTVWVCSRECELEALAISKYGAATHKWPISLAQFRSTQR